jgi:hypothetical protein
MMKYSLITVKSYSLTLGILEYFFVNYTPGNVRYIEVETRYRAILRFCVLSARKLHVD